MTISSETRKSGPYNGNGVVSQFPFYFKVFSSADVVVVRTVLGVEEILTEGPGGYEVAIFGDDGVINFYTPPASNELITITSNVAALQPVDLTNQGGFYPTVINNALDRLTIIAQQLKEAGSRSLTLPISSSETPDDFLADLISSADAAIAAAATIQSALDDFTIPSASALVGVDDGASGARYTTLAGRLTYMRTGNGALDVGTLAAGTGATARSLQTKLRDLIHVDDYGALGGATNDTVAFQNALNQAAALGGGTVYFSRNHRITGNLTIPLNTTLCGPLRSPGQLQPGDSLGDYDSKAGVIRLSSASTITVLASGAVVDCIIIRDGLELPFIDHIEAATGVAAFAGTALTAGGADCRFQNLLILGFARAIDSLNHARIRLLDVQGDCTNGIRIQNATDTIYADNCHFWPFTTANFSWTASDATQAILRRSGIAFEFNGVVDWCKVSDCFSYGYFRGFRLSGIASATLYGCAADETISGGVTLHPGSIGILIEGVTVDTKLIGCTMAGKATGYWITPTAPAATELIGCDAVACTSGVYIVTGDVKIVGGLLRACGYGLDINSTTSRVHGVAPRIMDSAATPVRMSGVNTRVDLADLDLPSSVAGASVVTSGTNWQLASIASAEPLPLPLNGERFLVSGAVTFGTVTGGYRGRVVTLLFSGAATATHGGSMRLHNSVNFVAATGSTLTLLHNGTQWYEIGRSQ